MERHVILCRSVGGRDLGRFFGLGLGLSLIETHPSFFEAS